MGHKMVKLCSELGNALFAKFDHTTTTGGSCGADAIVSQLSHSFPAGRQATGGVRPLGRDEGRAGNRKEHKIIRRCKRSHCRGP